MQHPTPSSNSQANSHGRWLALLVFPFWPKRTQLAAGLVNSGTCRLVNGTHPCPLVAGCRGRVRQPARRDCCSSTNSEQSLSGGLHYLGPSTFFIGAWEGARRGRAAFPQSSRLPARLVLNLFVWPHRPAAFSYRPAFWFMARFLNPGSGGHGNGDICAGFTTARQASLPVDQSRVCANRAADRTGR